MTRWHWLRSIPVAGFLLPISLGCLNWPGGTAVEPPPISYQVKCGGDCLQLNTQAAADWPLFLSKVEEHVRERRYASLDGLLQRRLDVAIEALRRRDAKQAPSAAELTLAQAVDARLHHPEKDGWLARLQGHGQSGLQRAEETLAKVQELTQHGQWSKARDLLQRNQTQLALYPYQAIQAGLVLAEAQRHLGRLPAAAQSWQQTAILAASLAGRWPAPALWERIAAQRPLAAAWPAEVATALVPLLPANLHDLPQSPTFAVEALVWYAIGNARLQRAEASAALTAFKRADSQGMFPLWDDFLGLHQARALLALEQSPAATSVLTALAHRSGSPWRLPALALLGSGKLQEGHTQQALAFLREAIEASSADYPFRAEAEADLGLTYLGLGDTTRGLSRLRTAQERFEKEGRIEVLLTCLENEVRFLEQAGRAEEVRQVQARMRTLQQPGR